MPEAPRDPVTVAAGILGWSLASLMIALVMVPIAAGPVIADGQASGRTSLVALALATSAILAILAARRVATAADEDLRRPLTAGIAAAGALALGLAILAPVVGMAGPNAFTVVALVASTVTVLAAVPVGGWLARDGRVVRAARVTVTSSGTISPHRSRRSGRVDLLVGAAILGLLAIGLAVVVPDGPFGHDESVYALKARSWTEGTPDTGWAIYRPLGMSWLGVGVLTVSSAELAFRTTAVVLSVATIAIMYIAGRIYFDRPTAILGTLVFMSTASFLRRATEFLNDVVAAGFLLAAMVAIWYHFERKPGGWWIMLSAPLAAGAYYFRYGSAVALAIIAIVAAVVWRGALVAAWRQILGAAALLAALLIPHFVQAIDATGSPFGVFTTARTSVGGGGGGLVDYVGWLPSHLAGPIGTALLAMAAAYTVFIAWEVRSRHDLAGEARTVLFTVPAAILVTVALGIFTHGEPRFVFLPLMLTLLTGARAITGAWLLLRHRTAIVAAVCASVVLVAGFGAGAWHMSGAFGDVTDSRQILVEASAAVQADVNGGECAIRSSYVPQLTWYSTCATYGFSRPMPRGVPGYLALFENGIRQPTGSALDDAIAATEGSPFVTISDPFGGIGDATIYRYP